MKTKVNMKKITKIEWRILWGIRIKKNKILIIRKPEHTLFLGRNDENYMYLGIKINVDGPQDVGIQSRINSGRYANFTMRNTSILGDKRVKRKTEQNISQIIIKISLC
jgi:hypothetical protein